jgi:ligand-binding sensor domain-containing protein
LILALAISAEALAYPPFTDDPTFLSDEQARAIIGDSEESLQVADVDALVDMINNRGPVVSPYAVGPPNRGLTDAALQEALEVMLAGAHPKVVSYQFRIGSLSVVAQGLNSVQAAPAHGEPLVLSSPVHLGFTQDVDGSWLLWSVIADESGDLDDTLGRTHYRPWK